MVERCKHGLIVGQCGLCADPLGPHERNYGEHGRVVITGQRRKPITEEKQDMAGKCVYEGCTEDAVAKGLCKKHWSAWYQGKIEHPRLGPWKPAKQELDQEPVIGPDKGPEPENNIDEALNRAEPAAWVPIEIELPPDLMEKVKARAQEEYRDPARQIAWDLKCIMENAT
jgi:hypothetical protein